MSSFASYASLRLCSPSKLLRSACSPDKDLILLVTSQEHKLLLGLWKIQGVRMWEVAAENTRGLSLDIVDVVWSPDGQIVGVAHDPPCVTLHSIQDGSEIRNLVIRHPDPLSTPVTANITGMWWLKEGKSAPGTSIPDILKRGPVIPGTAHSILNMIPLLDPVGDDGAHINAASMVGAAQANPSKSRATGGELGPEELLDWPSLPADPLTASIKPPRPAGLSDAPQPGEELDVIDDINLNSLLIVADSFGNVHPFLDGTYPLGMIGIGPSRHLVSMYKQMNTSLIRLYAQSPPPDDTLIAPVASFVNLFPFTIELPLLSQRCVRDVAQASSNARELLSYFRRLHKELWKDWHGDGKERRGIRRTAEDWMNQLVKKMQDTTDEDISLNDAVTDLLQLLMTGRPTECLSDFMSTHESMSERGFLKWETSVTEIYLKVRDYAEKRMAPAAQRLHLILEQVMGWAKVGQEHGYFQFDANETKRCLDLNKKLIFECASMAAKARSELSQFREFLMWIKWESARANRSEAVEATPIPLPRFDALEVHRYLTTSARGDHPLDDHFNRYKRSTADVNAYKFPSPQPLALVLERARIAVNDRTQTAWKQTEYRNKPPDEDFYLPAVLSELLKRCSKLFITASEAVGRTAILNSPMDPLHRPLPPLAMIPTMTRETWEVPQNGKLPGKDGVWHYLAMRVPNASEMEPQWVCFVRMKSPLHEANTCDVEVAMAAIGFSDNRSEPSFEILDMEFFGNEDFLLICRLFDGIDTGATLICLINYTTLIYQLTSPHVIGMSREELGLAALERAKSGELPISSVTVTRTRELPGCREGQVSLAVNGRQGRKVACVVDEGGMWVEMLDMDADDGADEGDEQTEDALED